MAVGSQSIAATLAVIGLTVIVGGGAAVAIAASVHAGSEGAWL